MVPGQAWRQFGREHPLGLERSYLDMVPESYDRDTLDAALEAVPEEMMMSIACWGTPDDIVAGRQAGKQAGRQRAKPDRTPLNNRLERHADRPLSSSSTPLATSGSVRIPPGPVRALRPAVDKVGSPTDAIPNDPQRARCPVSGCGCLVVVI